MAQVLIRNLDADVLARLKRQAESRALPLEAYLRELLIDAARPSREELLVEFSEIRRRSRPGGLAPDSLADLVRRDRADGER